MPRAIWSGSISFGLLNVPVKLYSAVARKQVSFRELRQSDGSRVRHKRVAESDGEEVVSAAELDGVIPDDVEEPKKREIDMAGALIDQLSSEFEPERYRDEYREELLAMIERKAAGEEVVEAVSDEPTPTKAPDLMAALEESLAAVRGEPLGAGAKGDGASRRKAPAKSKSKSSGSKS